MNSPLIMHAGMQRWIWNPQLLSKYPSKLPYKRENHKHMLPSRAHKWPHCPKGKEPRYQPNCHPGTLQHCCPIEFRLIFWLMIFCLKYLAPLFKYSTKSLDTKYQQENIFSLIYSKMWKNGTTNRFNFLIINSLM